MFQIVWVFGEHKLPGNFFLINLLLLHILKNDYGSLYNYYDQC